MVRARSFRSRARARRASRAERFFGFLFRQLGKGIGFAYATVLADQVHRQVATFLEERFGPVQLYPKPEAYEPDPARAHREGYL